LLKSGISSSLYDEFVSSYQSLHPNHSESEKPFVYVGEQGEMKLVTEFVDDVSDGEIFAISVAEDGWMEFLAFSAS
jgi:hypothetical protein